MVSVVLYFEAITLILNPADSKLNNPIDIDMHYSKILSQLGCKPQKISSKIIRNSKWWSLVFLSNFDSRDRNLSANPFYLRYFVSKIVLTYFEKNLFLWLIETFSYLRLKGKCFQNFEITATIYSNSESSEKNCDRILFYHIMNWRFQLGLIHTYIGTND